MKERILKLGQGLFTPPLFAQDEKNQIVRQVFPILWFHVLIVLIIAVVLTVLAPEFARYWLALAFSTIVINLFLIVLTRGGRTRLAAILLVGQLWLQISFLSWITSGFGSRAAWGYFIVVFIAGMLLGRVSGIITAVACSLSTLLLAVASPLGSSDPARFWLINSLYLLLVLLLQNLASRSIRESLLQARHELLERRQVESALVQSERRYREMVNSLPFCIFEMDLDGRIIFVNQAGLEWFGYSEAELLSGMTVFQILATADKHRAMENLRLLMSGQELGYSEYQVRCKDGCHFTVLIKSRLLLDGGKVVAVQGCLIDIRERKRAEIALQAREDMLGSIFRAAPTGIGVVRDRVLTLVNSRVCEMTGRTQQELIGKSSRVLYPSDADFEYVGKEKYRQIGEKGTGTVETRWQCKDGRIIDVLLSSTPINPADQSVGVTFTALDITYRKGAEAALRESEEKYRLTMDVAPIGIYIIQDLRFAFVNPEMARMHGYAPEEMIGSLSPPDDLVAPEHRELVRQTLLRRQAGVRGQPYEIRARRRDGSLFDALVWGQGISYGGKPASIGTLLDISERKHAEEAVRESEQRYHTLFEAASDSIFVMKDNLFFDCNSRTLEMFGCTRQQIIGVSPDRFSPPLQPDGRNSLQKAMEKITAAYSGIPQFFEWMHCRADGTPFIAEVSLNRFELASGPHLLAIVRDIAARKVLEEQLRQAQKMEAVGILAGGVAHDFNNILSTIVGYASLLQMQSCQDDKSKEYLERILASTERAASLTHSLLAFSRKQAIDLRPVDLNDAIFGFHKVLARLIGEDIEFMLNLSKEHLMVDADIRQIEQVLMNLATNARDAMPQGGKLTITTRSLAIEKAGGEMPNGPYAVISVCDTGSGMEKEIQEHLFEPFYTTKEVGKGTGLGLAIVYGIVKNHKGFIKLESAFTRGTTFHIYLPLKFQALPKSKRRLQAKIPRGHETILLVEDDAAVRHATRSMLEEFGYTIIEAADGQEALVVFEKNREQVDLLLSDLIMPKKNGRETRDAILKLQPGIKTIFMSGYTSDIIARKGIMEPGMHLLLKPLHPAELLEKIRAVLDS